MRVVVTGGSGKLGRFVVDDLVSHRYDVLKVDEVAPESGRSAYLKVDLTDYGQVLEALTGVDEQGPAQAVVHLAAIPAPGLRSRVHTRSEAGPRDCRFRTSQDRVRPESMMSSTTST